MRIDIVVSEAGKPAEKKRNKSTAGKTKNQGSKIFLDIPTDTPAFLCEKVAVELDLRKVADMTVDDLVQRQNVLYISRGQLKKHTSTTVNINVNIRYISQQVCSLPILWSNRRFIKTSRISHCKYLLNAGQHAVVTVVASNQQHVPKCERNTNGTKRAAT